MALDSEPNTHAPHPAHPARGVSGKRVLLWSLIGCVALFFLVWGVLRSVEQHVRDSRPHLIWSERTAWHAPAVIRATLVKPNAANAQYTYNKPRYRDPGLVITEAEEEAVLQLMGIAGSEEYAGDETRDVLLEQSRQTPHFYTDYLLATWHRLNGQPAEANGYYQSAFDGAPVVLVIRYSDENGNAVPNLRLDRVEIGCDRVTDEGTRLDQRLVLVYPHLETDHTGRVYLPVYDTTYRPVYLPQPEGFEVTYEPDEGWFKAASRTGLIKARVISLPG